MRVLFDAFWWANGPMSNRSVLREFVFSWANRFPSDDIAVAVPFAAIPLARLELENLASVTGTRLSPHGVSNMFELPIIAKRFRADITVTHNFAPLLGKSAVFVHDFIFKTNPEWFTMKERAYFELMPRSLPRASIVFTSTAAEARRVQIFGRRNALPSAVGLGLSKDLQAASPARPASVPQSMNFMLSVGRLNVRKNLSKTIEAALDSKLLSSTFPLLVVGEASGRGITMSPQIQRAIADNTVIFLGRVSDPELKWLYQHARLFVFLTLDEGFGMPVLEALSFNTPMIVSDIAVFREILGESATFVDPNDGHAISKALSLALLHPQEPTHGTGVLDYFTWDGAVERMRMEISTGIRLPKERRVTA
jgi:glycosyltransferase involved in cell wall biosynthesis